MTEAGSYWRTPGGLGDLGKKSREPLPPDLLYEEFP